MNDIDKTLLERVVLMLVTNAQLQISKRLTAKCAIKMVEDSSEFAVKRLKSVDEKECSIDVWNAVQDAIEAIEC